MNQRALQLLKHTYSFASNHLVALTNIIKYPILISSLLSRIKALAEKYDLGKKIHVIDLAKGKAAARKALKGLGGIYILHSKTTGLFYVGSALRFFDQEGRLNDYYTPSRVEQSVARKSSKVSYDLALLIQKYGMGDFTLIAIPVFPMVTEVQLKSIEQTWMLLMPTLNRSLSATSNNQGPMSEEVRQAMSFLIYIYEFLNNALRMQSVYGMKKIVNDGVRSFAGINFTIRYNELKGHLHSGLPWKDRFIFSKVELSEKDALAKFNATPVEQGKTKGVWVYDANTNKFVDYVDNVKDCEVKYNISRTHLKHVRRHGLAFNNMIFSNKKLSN